MVLREPIIVEPQIAVHAAPAVKALVAGVCAGAGVALIRKIACIAPARAAEIRQLGKPGQCATLGVDRAAREDIRKQLAGIALGLKRMIISIRIVLGDGVRQVGKVAERLQHRHHDVDFFVLRNVVVFIFRQRGLGLPLVVPVRRLRHRGADAVQERIDAAARLKLVVGRPCAPPRRDREAVVERAAAVNAEISEYAEQ